MQKLILILGVTVLFTSCKNKATSDNSEPTSVVSEIKEAVAGDDLKSVHYETETVMPEGMGTTSSKITTDDYGKKSRTESTTAMSFGGKTMNNSVNSLTVDGYAYSWAKGAKTGNKFKMDESRFDPGKTNLSQLTEEMRKRMNYKDEGTETIDGRECKVASYETDQMKGKIWMWKQVPVRMEMSMMGKVITTNVKNIEENPSIPAGTFDVPTGVEFKEMTMPKMPATAEK